MALVPLVVVAILFVLVSGRGVREGVQVTPSAEEASTTYITEYGHEVESPQVHYDAPRPAIVSSRSPIPSVYKTTLGKAMLGILGRDTTVQVLGESTNEQGDLYYLVRGFGMEGWMAATDLTIEEP